MGVTSQILIEKPNGGKHRPGQDITGRIRYSIDEPTEFHDIILSFVGKGVCSWSEFSYISVVRNLYVGTEEYLSVHQQILDKKGADSIIVPSGIYEQDFQFILPKNVPPSYNDPHCTITYKLKLKFINASSFKSIKKFYATITVQGTVESSETNCAVIFGLNKPLIKPLSSKTNEIDIKAKIDNTIIKPGDEAKISFVVTNDTDVIIPKLKINVICCEKYTANCGSTKSKTMTVKDVISETPSIPAEAVANLTNIIKTLPDMYSINNSKIISRQYNIKVTLKLPVPYVNSKVLLPIIMGVNEDEETVEILDDHLCLE